MYEKNKLNRCFLCRKKIQVALQGIACQCEQYFCSVHRLPETHHCSFNRREAHLKTAAAQVNTMKCVANKINKI